MSELYELPEGWEWKKINDIIVKTKNITPKNTPQSNFTYIDISSIDNDIFSIVAPKTILGKDAPSRAKKEVRINDIVFATTRPNLKNIAMLTEDYCNPVASTGFCILRTDKTENKYLFFYLLSNIFYKQVEKYIRGAQYPAISDKDVKSIFIPLPPLQEQKRIVAKLDRLFGKIDQAIALHQQNIDEAEALMGSVLDEVFGEFVSATKISLKEITIKIGSGSTPRGGQKSYKTEGISLIRSMNIHDAGFRTKGLAFIDDEQAKKLDNVTIKENDVLLNITGASVARCCIVDKNYLPARVNQHVSIIRLKEAVLSKFLHYYLISPSVKSDLLFSSSGGATREAITKSMLEAFEVPLVSLKTQQKTVQYLDQLSQKTQALKKAQEEKMQSLKELKASILDRAFRGEM